MALFGSNKTSARDNGGSKQSSGSLWSRLFRSRGLLAGELVDEEGEISAQELDALEDSLIMADVGLENATGIMEEVRAVARRGRLSRRQTVSILADQIAGRLAVAEVALDLKAHRPFVIVLVGVNGVGKTTTAARLAHLLSSGGCSVMLAACDTYRAAATEQLKSWGERLGIPVTAQGQGADAAAVAHDAYTSARARSSDVLIIDTAGRQHTHDNLMQQLGKLDRVLKKMDPAAPHEVMMVVDAGNGQNVLSQVEQFNRITPLTGIAVTKLDGTAKGGVVLALTRRFGLPIRYIGVGEQMGDLRPFNAGEFAAALAGSGSGQE